MAYIGHAMLGDGLYASKEIQDASPNRLCLHAYRLEFVHPITKEVVQLEAPLSPNSYDYSSDNNNN